MNREKLRKYEKNKIMIIVEVVLLIVLLLYVGHTFKYSKSVEFNTKNLQIVTEDDGVDFSIENISKYKQGSNDYIDIKGWVVEKNIESKETDTIRVVLKNTDTGMYYLIPTMRQMRKDVTKYLYDGTKYDESGFESKVRYDKYLNTDSNEYEIFVFLENRVGKKLINVEVKFNEWITNHQ